MENMISVTNSDSASPIYYSAGGSGDGSYTIRNDDGVYEYDTSIVGDWNYVTTNDNLNTQLSDGTIPLSDESWFYTHDDVKISLKQIKDTMHAVKLLGDIFKSYMFKPAISKSMKKFMEIVNDLPDITEEIVEKEPEHIEGDLFKI